MNKTIASVAILAAASSAFALIGPGGVRRAEPKVQCLAVWEGQQGEQYLGTCDESRLNQARKVKLLPNGCAEGQAALRTHKVKFAACTGIVQL